MDKILRIDVGAEGGPKYVEVPVGEYAGFGGRALTSAIISKEVPPLCHPLGAENKLVIAPGLRRRDPFPFLFFTKVGRATTDPSSNTRLLRFVSPLMAPATGRFRHAPTPYGHSRCVPANRLFGHLVLWLFSFGYRA